MTTKFLWIISWLLGICSFVTCNTPEEKKDSGIKPYEKNPRYWQYKGKPVLLLGASDDDNLFQIKNLETHLDSLAAVGGNYVRNTMSDRDLGNLRAFAKNSGGKYDLGKWNDAYWQQFEKFLKLAGEREIIVQIEVWDRFDHSREEWLTDPYNPKNNINYSYAEAGFDSLYPAHPGRNEQPFFFTVPELDNNKIVLKYQQAFVEKMLSVSLNYDNVLYCIDNETSGDERWATYWAEFIREKAGEKDIQITEMWNDWDMQSEIHRRTLDHPDRYDFVDISQNTHTTGYDNWKGARYIFDYTQENPRPVNSTKIYGSDGSKWVDRGIVAEHAVQTFCRNIVGGFASSRFHRPPAGLGLCEITMNSIRTIRKIEETVKFWDIEPRMDLITSAEENLAYIAAKEGESYVVCFTRTGKVKLDLSGHNHRFTLKPIDLENAEWREPETVSGGKIIEIESVCDEGCFVVLQRE